MNGTVGGLAVAGVCALCFALGWVCAHDEVKHECEKVGAFYVGDKVYECKLKGGAL